MSEPYDVIIVGGGYAGLCCGLKLKEKRVLILEARKEIGRKHRGCQCGLYSFGENFDIEGDGIYFHKNNIKVPGAVMSRLSALELVSGGHKISASLKNPMPLVDEGKIKSAIENLCKEAGMDIITGEKVRSVETNGDKVSVYTDKKYDVKYLVGADGAHSRIIRYLPFKRRRIGSFVELEVEAEHINISGNGLYGEMKGIKVGLYAQPYGKGYMLGVYQGLGMKDKMIDLRGYLEESIKKLNVTGIRRSYGCNIPIHLSSASSYHKNIIMTGDAVGALSMITIAGAMMMGLLAGEAVLKRMEGDEGAFKEYDKKWRKILQQGSIDGVRHLFFLFRRLNEKRISRLFGAIGEADLGFVGINYYLKRIPGIIKAFL